MIKPLYPRNNFHQLFLPFPLSEAQQAQEPEQSQAQHTCFRRLVPRLWQFLSCRWGSLARRSRRWLTRYRWLSRLCWHHWLNWRRNLTTVGRLQVVEDDRGQATIGPFDFPPFKLVTSNHFVVFIKIRGPVPIDYDRVRNWVPIFIIVVNWNLGRRWRVVYIDLLIQVRGPRWRCDRDLGGPCHYRTSRVTVVDRTCHRG